MPVESYLSQVNEICDGLYLCGARALRPQRLLDMDISCIFNVTIELPNLPIDPKVFQTLSFLAQ